jgi:magnesium transporter
MKVLTVIATTFLPLTFVVGVYGMNFADGAYNMPELGWAYGYPAVMVGMLTVALLMLWAFRRQGYL